MPEETPPVPPSGRLAAAVSDLRCSLRRNGARVVAARLIGRLRHALYTHEQVVVLVKDLDEITGLSGDEMLRVEPLEARHLPALYEFNRARCYSKANPRTADRLTRGYRGFVGFADDELVGYYWWVDRSIEPHHGDIARYGLDIELGPDEVYGFDFYLLEEHRGGGKAMEFLHKTEVTLRDAGYTKVWGYVVADNRPARWLYGLRGYRSVRDVAARRVLTRRIPVSIGSG